MLLDYALVLATQTNKGHTADTSVWSLSRSTYELVLIRCINPFLLISQKKEIICSLVSMFVKWNCCTMHHVIISVKQSFCDKKLTWWSMLFWIQKIKKNNLISIHMGHIIKWGNGRAWIGSLSLACASAYCLLLVFSISRGISWNGN